LLEPAGLAAPVAAPELGVGLEVELELVLVLDLDLDLELDYVAVVLCCWVPVRSAVAVGYVRPLCCCFENLQRWPANVEVAFEASEYKPEGTAADLALIADLGHRQRQIVHLPEDEAALYCGMPLVAGVGWR